MGLDGAPEGNAEYPTDEVGAHHEGRACRRDGERALQSREGGPVPRLHGADEGEGLAGDPTEQAGQA